MIIIISKEYTESVSTLQAQWKKFENLSSYAAGNAAVWKGIPLQLIAKLFHNRY
jgi:hypothetical protein